MSLFNFNRRKTLPVHIGNITLGGDFPIIVQTMTNTNTLDTQLSVEQCERIVDTGGQLVRLTAQGVREAENLENIRKQLNDKGIFVPLSADIHFNPRAAYAAAKVVEKVRINPGNFADKQNSLVKPDMKTNVGVEDDLTHVRAKFIPFLDICKEYKTAVRIGVNHGSLSDRIMDRYGDTPEGMVASCMEYLRIAREENFTDIVISMKTSNTLLMTKAVRMLVQAMDEENMHFPLHLGVTEAGDGEDGRIKSAVGIGALLADGLGDTIRVSLSEEPEAEIPVATKLVNYLSMRHNHPFINAQEYPNFSHTSTDKRQTFAVRNIGGDFLPIVISDRSNIDKDIIIDPHFIPDFVYVGSTLPASFPKGMKSIVDFDNWEYGIDNFPLFTKDNIHNICNCDSQVKFLQLSFPELSDEVIQLIKGQQKVVIILKTSHLNGVGEQRAFFHKLLIEDCKIPVVIHRKYGETLAEDLQIKSGADLGTLFLDGFGNGIMLENVGNGLDIDIVDACAFGILQASRVRTSKTDFISCPSCGRTLFDLQTTVAVIKQSFSHLKHLKIGIMGCIVNGPGEMADADYGYVGADHKRISLYKKKELIEKGIPQDEAVDRLIQLIKDNGDWVEPEYGVNE